MMVLIGHISMLMNVITKHHYKHKSLKKSSYKCNLLHLTNKFIHFFATNHYSFLLKAIFNFLSVAGTFFSAYIMQIFSPISLHESRFIQKCLHVLSLFAQPAVKLISVRNFGPALLDSFFFFVFELGFWVGVF